MRNKNVIVLISDAALKASVEKGLGKLGCKLSFPNVSVIQEIFNEVPHLVVVDEAFRGGQGLEIAHSLKENIVLKSIAVILLAGDPVSILKDGEAKADLYFKKNQDMAELFASAKELLTRDYNELDVNPLTHLPGIRSSILRLERAANAGGEFSVCCVDLVNLSAFNRVYGDSRGDEVIIGLSQIIRRTLAKEGALEDFVGHLGGDDFIILTHPVLAVSICEALIREFDSIVPDFYDIEDRKRGYIEPKNSQGVTARCPIMGLSAVIVDGNAVAPEKISEVGRIAAELKEHLRERPGSCYIKYQKSDAKPGKTAPREVLYPGKTKGDGVNARTTTADGYTAFFELILKQKRIRTLYQPIVELKSLKVIGYEALARGLDGHFETEADSLFWMARHSGHVKELDEICVESAFKAAQGLAPDRKLFINLNHESVIDSEVLDRLLAGRGKLNYENLVIEVTEQSLLRSFDKIKDSIFSLKEKGAALAIDDVGGGAVSLRDVAFLKPDYIKFDRSLVRQIDKNITKQQIALSINFFANSIHASVTAEGIETREELETVMLCGIRCGQGYLFARPGPAFPEVAAV